MAHSAISPSSCLLWPSFGSCTWISYCGGINARVLLLHMLKKYSHTLLPFSLSLWQQRISGMSSSKGRQKLMWAPPRNQLGYAGQQSMNHNKQQKIIGWFKVWLGLIMPIGSLFMHKYGLLLRLLLFLSLRSSSIVSFLPLHRISLSADGEWRKKGNK